MRRSSSWTGLVIGLLVSAALAGNVLADHDDDDDNEGDSRVQQGLDISPVRPDLHNRNRALVGIGSYIVNAVAGCNDCHTCPSYAPGHNPYNGVGDGRINAMNFLAGGVPFQLGPMTIKSDNLTPDPKTGKPENHSLEQFVGLMRTGHDPDHPQDILQVMPWPIFRNMADRDLAAIYEYLRSLPHAEPGVCQFPGQ